jgi:hypothetical protein
MNLPQIGLILNIAEEAQNHIQRFYALDRAGGEMSFGNTLREHLYTNQTHPYYRAPHIYIAIAARFIPNRQVLTEEQAEDVSVLAGRPVRLRFVMKDADLYAFRFKQMLI